MQNITRLIRLGAALAFAFALAVGYSTVSAAPASGASDCDSDPYCHWIPNWPSTCNALPCHSDEHICCLP